MSVFRLAVRVGSARENVANRLLVVPNRMLEGTDNDRVLRVFRELRECAAKGDTGQRGFHFARNAPRLFRAIHIRVECLDVACAATEEDNDNRAVFHPIRFDCSGLGACFEQPRQRKPAECKRTGTQEVPPR